jgi:hypothetical protein
LLLFCAALRSAALKYLRVGGANPGASGMLPASGRLPDEMHG